MSGVVRASPATVGVDGGDVVSGSYTWEPLGEGEVPSNGDVLRLDPNGHVGDLRFIGLDPRRDDEFWAVNDDGGVSGDWTLSARWLRRVERPHRWERWANIYDDNNVSATHDSPDALEYRAKSAARIGVRRVDVIRYWCSADGELGIERVEVDQ